MVVIFRGYITSHQIILNSYILEQTVEEENKFGLKIQNNWMFSSQDISDRPSLRQPSIFW